MKPPLLHIAAALIAASLASQALAADLAFDLSADPAARWHDGNTPYSGRSGSLVCSPCTVDLLSTPDAHTGATDSAAFTLATGDSLQGVLRLAAPLTIGPSAAGVFLNLHLADTPLDASQGHDIWISEPGQNHARFELFNGNQPVLLPGLLIFGGSGGDLSFAAVSHSAQPAFTFDRIEFGGRVDAIQDPSAALHASIALGASPMQLTVFTSAVPEPASLVLLLAGGLALLGWRQVRPPGACLPALLAGSPT